MRLFVFALGPLKMTPDICNATSPTGASHQTLFRFEMDFSATLRCIPMAVRRKLDLSGIKLSLRQWNRFSLADREKLLNLPCENAGDITAYRDGLLDLIRERTDEEAKRLPGVVVADWLEVEIVPQAILSFSAERGVAPPSLEQWQRLTELQRFALMKLTRDHHDNENFIPAMHEFGLLSRRSEI